MLNRNYIEYHSDRFKDHSLILMKDKKVISLFPAEENKKEISSHNGLTYGGLILKDGTSIFDVLTCFYFILKYYHGLGIKQVSYKTIPFFYHAIPSFEDQYAIFVARGKLIRIDTYLITKISKEYDLQYRRERGIKKALKGGIKIIETNDLRDFWTEVLSPNLMTRFRVKPSHSIEEIELLKKRFPQNILHFNAIYNGKVVAGTTIFIKNKVVHAQYISGNDIGRETGAIDLLFYHLLTKVFKDYEWFSFGTTNENHGKKINIGLTQWKEGFDAKVIPHYFYKIKPENYHFLEKYIIV
ncbi:MAG: GNAT family N-acetyltransferase [Actinobacteria bacterium]|nr:GNAT family N-acetyltransferase [Actinomycetota bacterium]